MKRWTAIALLALFTSAGSAAAQGYPGEPAPWAPPAPAPVVRAGFVFGLGLGIGNLQLRDQSGRSGDFASFFYGVHFGGMLSPRAALLAHLWGSSHELDHNRGDSLNQHNAGVAVQFWATPRFWLKGGLGSASLSYRDGGLTRARVKGGAFLGAVGYELLHTPYYSLDVELRLTSATYREPLLAGPDQSTAGALQISFNWY